MNCTTNPTHQHAMVLFAHGSRQNTWRMPFDLIAQKVSERHPNVQVALAFLEFMTPTLAESLKTLADQGIVSISIVPLFFGIGNHVARDLDALIQDFADAHPHVQLNVAPAVGQSPVVLDAMADYAGSLLA